MNGNLCTSHAGNLKRSKFKVLKNAQNLPAIRRKSRSNLIHVNRQNVNMQYTSKLKAVETFSATLWRFFLILGAE